MIRDQAAPRVLSRVQHMGKQHSSWEGSPQQSVSGNACAVDDMRVFQGVLGHEAYGLIRDSAAGYVAGDAACVPDQAVRGRVVGVLPP